MGSTVVQSLSCYSRLTIVGSLILFFSCLLASPARAESAQTNSASENRNGDNVQTKDEATNSASQVLEILGKSPQLLTPAARTNLSQLIAAGANLEAKDADGRTALIHAVLRGDIDTIRLLIEGGANAKARDHFHKTALFYATDAGRRDIVDYLASNGDLQSITYGEQKHRKLRQ